jgi:FG-GAP-like repeat
MKTKTSHIRNSTKRSFRHCGSAAGLLIPLSSRFRSTSRSANEIMKVGISLIILFAPAVAFAQTYPLPIRTPNGQMPFGLLTLLAGGASDSTKAASFQIVDQLPAHQDDFWANMLVGDANHNGRQEIVVRSTPVNGGRSKFIFYEDDGTGHFDPVWSIGEPDGGLLAMGDIDGDGLTDLFIERDTGVVCHDEFVRYEASSPSGFPDHIVWTAPKEGNVIDFKATIADVDGDGILELVTTDNTLSCLPTSLKVFESAPNDQMNLIFNYVIGETTNLGNPVVADFDLDGRNEIVVAAEGPGGYLMVFEGVGNDSIVFSGTVSHSLFNAYQVALVDVQTPDGRPIVVLAGQADSLDYRALSYEMLSDNVLTQTSETLVPNNCGGSTPQIVAADLFGTGTQEIVLDRLCGPVPIYTVGSGGALTLFEAPSIDESIEVIGTRKTRVHSGAIAIGTVPTTSNPKGKTFVLELQ